MKTPAPKYSLASSLLLALIAGIAACSSEESAAVGEPAGAPKSAPSVTATRVEVAEMSPSALTVNLVRPGEVEPVRDSAVAAPLGGAVEKVQVEVGERVKEGDVLARVDSQIQNANLGVVNVELKDARRELKRLRSLGKSVARARVDAAETRVERAEAQARLAKIQASRTVIRAPFAGVVADVGVEEGEVLAPGMMVARVLQIEPALVSVSVADRDVVGLKVGGAAAVTATGVATAVEGKIRRIEPAANLKTRTFRVEVELPNEGGAFLPGMIASVDFRETVAPDAILLPQDFLVTRLDGNGVFVVEDDVARWRPLELGQIVRDRIVVTGGLSAGERVVILGHRSLEDGDELIVAREGKCCTDGRVVFPQAGGALAAAEEAAP